MTGADGPVFEARVNPGGRGLGIDRVVMLFTGSRSTRDVILFPLLREVQGNTPEEDEPQER